MADISDKHTARDRHNRVWPALRLSLLLCTATISPAGAQQASTSFADGDVLKITAYGREDLTGQYSVQAGPILSLPLIGTVKLDNHSLRQLETELSTAWENRLGAPMSVTIEFAQRAPIYVLGAVNSPGAYPYRDGMSVLQAVAVSGGLQRQLTVTDNLRIDLIRERERRLQALERLAGAIATQARLIAERDNKKQLTLEEPFPLLPQSRMDALLAQEQALMEARNRQAALQKRLLSEQIRLSEAEIGSYRQQYNEMDRQQAQIAKEAARIRRVPGQQTRAFELEQRAAALETMKASVTGSISRASREAETAQSGLAEMREARVREITEGLLATGKAIAESNLTEAAASGVLAAAGYEQTSRSISFKLMKQGKEEVVSVTSSATLSPGDVLDVSISDTGISRHAMSER